MVALLAIVLSATGNLDAFGGIALPLVGWGSALALVVVVVIRYLPLRGLHRAAIVCLVAAVATVTTAPVVDVVIEGVPFAFEPVDLTTWSQATVNGNVTALTALACVAAAIVLIGLSFVPGGRGRVGPVDGDAVAA